MQSILNAAFTFGVGLMDSTEDMGPVCSKNLHFGRTLDICLRTFRTPVLLLNLSSVAS